MSEKNIQTSIMRYSAHTSLPKPALPLRVYCEHDESDAQPPWLPQRSGRTQRLRTRSTSLQTFATHSCHMLMSNINDAIEVRPNRFYSRKLLL